MTVNIRKNISVNDFWNCSIKKIIFKYQISFWVNEVFTDNICFN